MPSYTPVVVVYPSGVVSVESVTDTSYDQILASMGSMMYQIRELYLKTNSINQLLEPISFQKYDANGNIVNQKTVPTADPFQYQTSLSIEFKSKGYILDGKLSIEFSILPSEIVFFYLDTNVLKNEDLLPFFEDSIFEDWYDNIFIEN